jgi:hypothetical protein
VSRPRAIGSAVLLLALWGLAAAVRLAGADTVSTGSDALGQYLAAMAVLRGGVPFVPNPEGGHSLWAWVLPLVAVAGSLQGLVKLRMVQAALIAPVGAAAAALLADPEDRPLWVGASAAGAGVLLALDPGLVDTLQVAFRGYAAPELLAVATLGGALALRGHGWGVPVAAAALVGASGQHPLATGAALGALAALPWLVRAVGWRWVLGGVALGAVLAVPRLAHLAGLASCGQGALTCLGAVASGSADPGGDILWKALHDRILVEGPLPWGGLALGLLAAGAPGPGADRRRGGLAFALGAVVGIAALGLSLDTFRPYHLRMVAAPLAVVAAAGLARLPGLPLLLAALATFAWSGARPIGPGTGGVLADRLGLALSRETVPVRLDGAWFGSPVGVEPAPIALAAVLAGLSPDRLSLAPGTPVVLLVSGPVLPPAWALDRGEGWFLLHFDEPDAAVAWVAAQDPPPVVVGGALDWQKGVHPRLPEGWDPGWPPR